MIGNFKKAGLVTLAALSMAQPASGANIKKMDIEGRPTIVVMGEILEGDAEKFTALSATMSRATVLLESDGGDLDPAVKIGREIRRLGYTTMVPANSYCASACALIWIAGAERIAEKTARVGFHAGARIEGRTAVEDGVANALIGSYLARLGLSDEIIELATTATPSEMLYLDTSRPGAEGIAYQTYAYASGIPAAATAGRQPVAPAYASPSATPGRWKLFEERQTGRFQIAANNSDQTASIRYACTPGVLCAYLFQTQRQCRSGSQYTMEYSIDAGPRTKFDLVCSSTGKSLRIVETGQFNTALDSGSRLTIHIAGGDGFKVEFTLDGRMAAIKSLENSGRLRRIET